MTKMMYTLWNIYLQLMDLNYDLVEVHKFVLIAAFM